MFYESREHRTRPVSSAAEAAAIIVCNQAAIYDALTWTAETGRQLCAVDDGHIDRPWSEVAVIRLDTDPPTQIESITFAWLPGDDGQRILEGARHLARCEVTDFAMGATSFPSDGHGEDVPATFQCGCCGAAFASTLAQQRPFDQDAGFGICPDCEKFHHFAIDEG